ncbi:uncharacterized protein LOC121244009 [Juglans microcarpa x Juglans regia]|uniref:uncharacterized protein LOC121244009 n=1 Tax=Juglans microcarpa x Juglans regia TaxID=2249226 RepID=UPI001B7E1E44|nr:uncharacterized protein LOC121244009 [Juglans microcarpa x Juglans regia]
MERRVVFEAIKTHPMIRPVSIVVNLLLVRFVFFARGIFIDSAKRFTIVPDPKCGPALFSIVARVRREKVLTPSYSNCNGCEGDLKAGLLALFSLHYSWWMRFIDAQGDHRRRT